MALQKLTISNLSSERTFRLEAWQDFFSLRLQEDLNDKRTKNSRLSLRGFANRLELSPGALSEVMRKKRKVSKKKALEVADKLNWQPKTVNMLKVLMGQNVDPWDSGQPSPKVMSLYSDWLNIMIIEFFNLNDPKITPDIIAKKLDFPLAPIKERIQLLLDNKILEKNEYGQLKFKTESIDPAKKIVITKQNRIVEEDLNFSVRAWHKNLPDSVFGTFTLVSTRENIPLLKKEIQNAMNKFTIANDEIGKKNELINFSVQIYPVDLESKD